MKLLQTIPIIVFVSLCFYRLDAQKKLVNQSPISKTETLLFADTARFLEKTTELGLALGQVHYNGDLSNDKVLKITELTPMAGVFVRRHLTPNLALRGNLMLGKLKAQDKGNTIYPDRNFSFSTNTAEFSLQAEWNIFGKKRFRRVDTSVYILDRYRQFALVNKFKRTLCPYLFAGGGGIRAKPAPYFDPLFVEKAGFQERVAADRRATEKANTNWGVLFGGGITFDLGRNWLIGGELGARSPFSDYLDGISQTGNPNKNDWYWFGALNLSVRLGKKDRDGDGVPDDKDRCPNTPGRGLTRGCPDADGDKIADREDECPHKPGVDIMAGCPLKDVDNDSVPDLFDLCPDVPGLTLFKGCPDTDLDGIEDKLDSCLTVAGLAQFNGCPDTDLDGFEDKVDECPQEKGSDPWYKGCPTRDTDRDSIEDKLDLCPTLAGKIELNGCPDQDNDGITDLEDSCPDKAGKAEFKGCPDSDGDGVPDPADACPDLAGKTDNRGCPVIEKKDAERLKFAVNAVKFETGKAKLKSESNKILTEVAKIMEKYRGYLLSIEGHTDNVGSDKTNQILSEKRAQACLDFLVKKGVDRTRMKSAGYGESKPVAENKSALGRGKNRRVEFNLYLPE